MKSRTEVELLAELEKELAELQTTIAVLKRRVGTSTDSAVGNGSVAHPQPSDEPRRSHERPFLGLSILDAARKHLQRVQEPQSPSEIAEALRAGGVHSRSNDFSGIVRTTLFKRGHERAIESFGSGKWGLRDWRPGGAKASAETDSTD